MSSSRSRRTCCARPARRSRSGLRSSAAPSRSAPRGRWRSARRRSADSSSRCRRSSAAWRARSRASSASAASLRGSSRRWCASCMRAWDAAPGDRQPRLRAQAADDARLLGRDPAAQRDRDGGHGRPLRLRHAGHDQHRRGRAAPRRPRAAAGREVHRGRREGARSTPTSRTSSPRPTTSASCTSHATRGRRATTSRSSRPRATSASSSRAPSSS